MKCRIRSRDLQKVAAGAQGGQETGRKLDHEMQNHAKILGKRCPLRRGGEEARRKQPQP